MIKKIKFVLNSVAYGLAAALIVVILNPELRNNLGINKLTTNVMRPAAMSFASAVQQAAPSVVNVYSVTGSGQAISRREKINDLGSGVIMTSNGHILTNYHVVDNAESILVHLQDGRQFNAEVIGLDKVTDLALLKINANNLPTIPQQSDLEPQVGDIVLAIGNPLNFGQTITQGIVSATGKKGLTPGASYSDFIQMDAAINLGNSGGALVNSQGMLVGINTAASPGTKNGVQGIFFAIPYQLAKRIMNKLMEDGEVKRGYLGLEGEAINQVGQPVRSSIESIAGIRLTYIDPLGPAWKSGLKFGDVLLAVNDKQLVSFSELLGIVEHVEPGETISLTVSRSNKVIKINVEVGKLEID